MRSPGGGTGVAVTIYDMYIEVSWESGGQFLRVLVDIWVQVIVAGMPQQLGLLL